MIQLYNYFRSSASYRVRIALNLKEIPYEAVEIHLINNGGEQYSSSFQAINPQGLVPILRDGDKIITQSIAIIEYLDEAYPRHPLLPKDAYQKALARSFALAITSEMHPLNNLRVLQYLKKNLGLSEAQKDSWYKHWIAKGFSALEKQISSSPFSGDYCFGNTPTVADIYLVPQMYNARRFSCDLSPYPTLTKIDEYCQKHPAFIKAKPASQ